MSAYLDASCLAMLTLQDTGWQVAQRWLRALDASPVYSDFGWGELVSAIALRVRMSGLTAHQGTSAIAEATVLTASWPIAPRTGDDLAVGARFVGAFEVSLRFLDAIHLAIARRLQCTLVTADRRQATAARAFGIPVFNPLEEPR